MALFETLSRNEARLFEALCAVPDNTLWGLAISKVMDQPEPKKFRELVKQLKSQTKDNEPIMISILGESTTKLLKNC